MNSTTATPPRSYVNVGLALLGIAALIVAVVLVSGPTDASTDLADGTVVEVEGGAYYLIWEGGKQRIQQPAALSDHDLETLGLTVGEPAPSHLSAGEEGTRFVIHPFDDPDAALYLVQDGQLHEVRVAEATLAQISPLEDLDELLITRMRIP